VIDQFHKDISNTVIREILLDGVVLDKSGLFATMLGKNIVGMVGIAIGVVKPSPTVRSSVMAG